jgi:hypothetical protein
MFPVHDPRALNRLLSLRTLTIRKFFPQLLLFITEQEQFHSIFATSDFPRKKAHPPLQRSKNLTTPITRSILLRTSPLKPLYFSSILTTIALSQHSYNIQPPTWIQHTAPTTNLTPEAQATRLQSSRVPPSRTIAKKANGCHPPRPPVKSSTARYKARSHSRLFPRKSYKSAKTVRGESSSLSTVQQLTYTPH